MTPVEAERLLAPAVPAEPGTWLDLGAGDGRLTRALAARLGSGRILALDRHPGVRRLASTVGEVVIEPVVGDIEALDAIGGLPASIDGALCANVLHFAPDAAAVLRSLADRLAPGSRVVIVEYDRERGSRWVPYPISIRALPGTVRDAGLGTPEIVARRPSRYGGELYVAVLGGG